MYHIIYETTNLINNKTYIGKHSTNCIDDGYLGSGTAIKAAIEKYGRENFSREVLFVFSDEKDAYKKEAELVTESHVAKKDNYNLRPGGEGGFSMSDEYKNEASMRAKERWSDPEYKKRLSEKQSLRTHSDKTKAKMSASAKESHAKDRSRAERLAEYNKTRKPMATMKDKKHTEEALAKIKAIANSRPRVCCVLCGKEVVANQLSRHYDSAPCKKGRP